MKKAMYRQGDVLIVRTDEKPDGEKVKRDKGRVVLAYGEVTGHAHAIKNKGAVLWKTPSGMEILAVDSESELVHEEHDTIKIPPGCYEIRHQREYKPEGIRRVAD